MDRDEMVGDEIQDDAWFSDDHATFGDRLAGAREDAGMSQKDLAKRLGVKLSTLRNWEEDLAEPRANKLSMASGVLGVSLSWLLTGEGEGVDPPGESVPIPQDIAEILGDLRQLRTEASNLAHRIGVTEKRLRKALGAGNV